MKRICFLRPQLLNSATVFHTLVGEWLLQWQWQCSNVTTKPLQAPVELRNPETWEQQQPPIEAAEQQRQQRQQRVHIFSSAAAEYSFYCCCRVIPSYCSCSIFSSCSFTDFSQNSQTLKFSMKRARAISIPQKPQNFQYHTIA